MRSRSNCRILMVVMKIKQIYIGMVIALGIIGAGSLLMGAPAAALECAGVDTSVIGGSACDGISTDSGDVKQSAIWVLLVWVVNIMMAGVAVLAVGGIVYGAILYTSAGGNQEQVKKAIGIITNVVIGIVAFAAMWAIIQWLIPGGVFNSSGGL